MLYGLNPVMATLLGMLTGIGGGMARDILLTDIPTVLRGELYAVAALLGAATVVIAHVFQLPAKPAALVGAALCFGLRVLAINDPVAPSGRWLGQLTITISGRQARQDSV